MPTLGVHISREARQVLVEAKREYGTPFRFFVEHAILNAARYRMFFAEELRQDRIADRRQASGQAALDAEAWERIVALAHQWHFTDDEITAALREAHINRARPGSTTPAQVRDALRRYRAKPRVQVLHQRP